MLQYNSTPCKTTSLTESKLNKKDVIGPPVYTGTATQSVHIQKENNPLDHHEDTLCHDDEDLCDTGSGSVQHHYSE